MHERRQLGRGGMRSASQRSPSSNAGCGSPNASRCARYWSICCGAPCTGSAGSAAGSIAWMRAAISPHCAASYGRAPRSRRRAGCGAGSSRPRSRSITKPAPSPSSGPSRNADPRRATPAPRRPRPGARTRSSGPTRPVDAPGSRRSTRPWRGAVGGGGVERPRLARRPARQPAQVLDVIRSPEMATDRRRERPIVEVAGTARERVARRIAPAPLDSRRRLGGLLSSEVSRGSSASSGSRLGGVRAHHAARAGADPGTTLLTCASSRRAWSGSTRGSTTTSASSRARHLPGRPGAVRLSAQVQPRPRGTARGRVGAGVGRDAGAVHDRKRRRRRHRTEADQDR